MRRVAVALAVVNLLFLFAFALPVAAGVRWCSEGTPPGLATKDDKTFPAFAAVEAGAGFSLHDVHPFLGNTAKTSAAAQHNPNAPQGPK